MTHQFIARSPDIACPNESESVGSGRHRAWADFNRNHKKQKKRRGKAKIQVSVKELDFSQSLHCSLGRASSKMISIKVPCSSANIGPGFDVVGN